MEVDEMNEVGRDKAKLRIPQNKLLLGLEMLSNNNQKRGKIPATVKKRDQEQKRK
jgi:hypothetical protein